MADLESLMRNVLRAAKTRGSRGNEQPASPDFACEQRQSDLALRLRSLPRIPANWRSLVRPPIIAAVSSWRWGDGNLILLGDTGCGKTLGAAVLARRLLVEAASDREWRRARRLVFVDAARLAVAREQHGLGEGEAPLVQKCMGTPLLFLDELGYLDKDTGIVEQVIDARSKAGLPVVVTSGMQPIELQGRYGSATARKMMRARTSDVLVQVFSP